MKVQSIAQWEVPDHLNGQRLQDALPELAKLYIPSRKGCKKAIKRGRVQLNERQGSTGDWVRTGDRIVLMPSELNNHQAFVCPKPPIAFLDEDLMVVWKKAGLFTSGNHPQTLRSQVAQHFPAPNHPQALTQAEPIHRLDFPTSGFIIFARTQGAVHELGQAMEERRIKKSYWTVIHGLPAELLDIRMPLAGQHAHTRASRLAEGTIPTQGDGALLEITLETGRTHQIRKHLHALGHGVVGDEVYQRSAGRYHGHGLFLCASGLTFQHPIHQTILTFKADLPKKFRRMQWIRSAMADVAPTPLY
ncbi:MAG: RluA family pseudouridine synthase [Flavobacteriales bacterium]|nr:RluA family pseudouridine synthase [Flavobacteriales bacterium]